MSPEPAQSARRERELALGDAAVGAVAETGRPLRYRDAVGRTTGGANESRFDLDTAVVRDDEGWVCDLHQRWHTGEGLNGGYLLAVMVRAMLAEAGRPDPVTVTAHYLSRPCRRSGQGAHRGGEAGPNLRHGDRRAGPG